jgi:anti-sigma factor RsiW
MMPDKELRDIEAFVNGTLPQDRYAAFVSQLQSNPDLKEKVRLYRMMQVGLLQLRFQHRINSKRRTRLLPFTAKQVGYMAAAAVILIIGSLFLIPSLMRSSTDELFDFMPLKPVLAVKTSRLPH